MKYRKVCIHDVINYPRCLPIWEYHVDQCLCEIIPTRPHHKCTKSPRIKILMKDKECIVLKINILHTIEQTPLASMNNITQLSSYRIVCLIYNYRTLSQGLYPDHKYHDQVYITQVVCRHNWENLSLFLSKAFYFYASITTIKPPTLTQTVSMLYTQPDKQLLIPFLLGFSHESSYT